MLKQERESLTYNNLILLNNHGIKELIDIVEGIVSYLNCARLENKEKFESWRFPKIPSTKTLHLEGESGLESVIKIDFNEYGNEMITFQNYFLYLTAKYELGELFPNIWSAEFKDSKAIGGIEAIEYKYNVPGKQYPMDIISSKFINNIYYRFWVVKTLGNRKVVSKDYYRLIDGVEEGCGLNASKDFNRTLIVELEKLGIIPGEKRFDLSALELMAIDKSIARISKQRKIMI